MRKGGVRIAAGGLKGTRLAVPGGVRPTSQRVREAVFSHWQDRIVGAVVLDLFSGSGAVGLEAASRGAASVRCVEGRPRVAAALRDAARRLVPGSLRVTVAMLPGGLKRDFGDTGAYDLIFVDPPYDFDEYDALLERVGTLLAQNGEVAVEHSVRSAVPESTGSLVRVARKRYGESCISYYRAEDVD